MNQDNGNASSRQETLKKIIRQLHDGVSVDALKKEFSRLIKKTSPEEIAEMENQLIREGFPPEEIQKLCDVHVQVFEQSLKRTGRSSKIPGHPLHTFILENREAKKILKSLKKSTRKLRRQQPRKSDIDAFIKQFNRLKEIETHYQRKENQLFPVLEAKKFTGPTQVMWGKHDEIRTLLKGINDLIERNQWPQLSGQVKAVSSAIKKLIFLEEKILFPTSARKISDREWADIKEGETEIGYAWIKPSNLWDAGLVKAGAFKGRKNEESSKEPLEEKTIRLSQGQLTSEQIDLILKNLPLDITFVDENDKVCYYSDAKERIFPRSPAIIGREVQNCHPPKSVHIVNDIVRNFKEKKKGVAEFWIQKDGKFIYIRYFPVYDHAGTYRGVIEVSQEVSKIKRLEGERRLPDW